MRFPTKPKVKQFVYLDYAAATPVDPGVRRAMAPFARVQCTNPSALYTSAVKAKRSIETARKQIAEILGTQADTIFFTGSGTESTNTAILGTAKRYTLDAKRCGHIITTAIEHHAVLEPIRQLERIGWRVTYLPVDRQGGIQPEQLAKALRKDTVLVSIMYANNEIGTIEPVARIGSEILKWRKRVSTPYPYFHTDACQTAGFLDLRVDKLHVDLLSLNASKIYGPKGVGLLYVRRNVPISPIVYGGGQELGLRSGTENVAGMVGLSVALKLVQREKAVESRRVAKLRDYFWREIQKKIPNVLLSGPPLLKNRLPNNLNITFKGVEAEALILYLDAYGVECSSRSACTTESEDISHVLKACGLIESDARGSVRFTLGRQTTKKKIDYVLKYLVPVVEALRSVKILVELGGKE